MTAHTHTSIIDSCYRCALGAEEAQESADLTALEAVIERAMQACRFPDEDLAIDAADAVARWACTEEGRAALARFSRYAG